MSDQFETPPAGVGRTSSDFEEEAGVEEFVSPPEGRSFEAAAVAASSDALSGVPPALLEAKNAIEQHLEQASSQMVGFRALSDFTDSGAIQGVGIGLGEAGADLGGVEPGSPVLSVYVSEPTSTRVVRSVVANSVGAMAAAVDDVPLQVIETGIIDIQPHRFRSRPAPGGISIGHYKVSAGTIGCLCRGTSEPRNRRRMILSNNHVVANSNAAVFGDCVSQPGPYDGGRCPADQVAILERFVPVSFDGSCNYVDCATAWCYPDRVRSELVYLSGGAPAYFRIGSTPIAPVLGASVGKSGRTTQLTSGRITAIGVTVNVSYGGGRVARFCDQIAIRATLATSARGETRGRRYGPGSRHGDLLACSSPVAVV
jgi:hypothetical protein